jgi:hypothetical protein
MGRSPDEYFSADSVPEDFVWEDPSHMLIDTIHGLLAHWYQRQDKGKVCMEFIGCPSNDFVKKDHRRKLKGKDKEDQGEEKNASLAPEPLASCPPAEIVDDKAPFSMLYKTAEDKIVYLRSLCGDGNYQKMVDTLAESDKVYFSTEKIRLSSTDYLHRMLRCQLQRAESGLSGQLGYGATGFCRKSYIPERDLKTPSRRCIWSL